VVHTLLLSHKKELSTNTADVDILFIARVHNISVDELLFI